MKHFHSQSAIPVREDRRGSVNVNYSGGIVPEGLSHHRKWTLTHGALFCLSMELFLDLCVHHPPHAGEELCCPELATGGRHRPCYLLLKLNSSHHLSCFCFLLQEDDWMLDEMKVELTCNLFQLFNIRIQSSNGLGVSGVT